jgi:hypothetical protein
MRPKIEHRRKAPRLPPILEIDEDGVPVSEMHIPPLRRWSADEEDSSIELGDWPMEFDD